MTSASSTHQLTTRLVNGLLAIKPIAQFAKHQARTMMIRRAESIGVPWTQLAAALRDRRPEVWEAELRQVQTPDLKYPDYYQQPFHAYETGNLSWEAAMEVEAAAKAVHARIWPEAGAQGDARLRQSYHDVLLAQIPSPPKDILDLGCGVGMSTFVLKSSYPYATITGLDLSPYFLAIAQYRSREQHQPVRWLHRPAEDTQCPDQSFDLISICLVCHELPRQVTQQIFAEARRLLRPHGHLALMDMNPESEVVRQMPPYAFTLLKSTEPYLDDYFSFNIAEAMVNAGFQPPTLTHNSPRHRTFIAQG
jgi:ubiquinone/menaquinone biosynthesis C-methylase UbiE